MIQFTQGNLLEADVDAVVNTVNTVGVMGKGIALMFKERYRQVAGGRQGGRAQDADLYR